MIWSSGARVGRTVDVAPDLFGTTPGGNHELLYDNPNRDSRLEFIDGVGDQVAFMELNDRLFGEGGWRLWYLAPAAGKPVLVDTGAGSELPFFGISERYMVWAIANGKPDKTELRLLDLASMTHRVLLSDRLEHVQFWFPDVDGTKLVYGTVELSADESSDERHVYLMDLAASAPPRRLDNSTSASEPAIHGDDVVWKESDPTLNFLNAGQLVHYSLQSGQQAPLQIPTPEGLGFTDPSIGDRYVTAWGQFDRRLALADLQTGAYPTLVDLGPTNQSPHDAVGTEANIAGDLLAYVFGPAKGDLELRWALLR